MPTLEPLADYEIDPQTGFMPAWEPLDRLPAAFEAWDALAPIVGHAIRNGRIREHVRALPSLDVDRLASRAERERALTLLTVFANAYVWGGREPDLRIPAPLALPLCRVAALLDRQPIVHYASMQLYNWRRIDRTRALSADNAELLVQFLGGVDETWFYVATLDLELLGGPLLAAAHAAIGAAARDDRAVLATALREIAARMPAVHAALERQREWTDPHIFFHRVRPFVAGWPAPGAVYEGVSDAPRMCVGGSAGQSSLMQSLDAALCVAHEHPNTGAFLRLMRAYMPSAHRRFVEDCERLSTVRAVVEASGAGELRDAYNAAVESIVTFRTLHVRLAHDFIAKPSGMDAAQKGTGGTSFVDFLRDTRRETVRAKVGPS